MHFLRTSTLLLAFIGLPCSLSGQALEKAPTVILDGVAFRVEVSARLEPVHVEVRDARGALLGQADVPALEARVLDGLVVTDRAQLPLEVGIGEESAQVHATFMPGWFSLLPPLLAIVLALLFREVVTALFAGVWLGSLAVAGFNPLTATWRLIDTFVVPALGDTDGGHTQIVVFSLLLGGMVGIIARNGGTMGIVEAVAPFARTTVRGKLATWAAGLAIFFDDYANTLIVGTTMRPITDRLKISREKLAYLVDSTAAPVAALIPISTWVGYEISLINDGLRIASEQNPDHAAALVTASPFAVFLHTIPYLFYPLLALFFVFLTSVMDRDFGPMADAERRAATGQGLHRKGAQLTSDTSAHIMDPKEGATHRWWNAGVPVLTVIVVVLFGLYATGRAGAGPDASLMDVFGAADPFATLLWGSLAGCLMALLLSAAQGILTITEGIDAWLGGIRAMVIAMIILVLAWSLGSVTEQVGTAQYLATVLSGQFPLHLLPVLVFITAAAMSFATGTSWGTMAILLPLVIPLTVSLGGDAGFDGGTHYSILLGAISSVLAGAIFGDHCSPISDTTVLSSTASACDHVDHVRTQLPYALLVAVVGMLVGDIGTAYGLPNWVALTTGATILFLCLRFFGRRVHDEAPAA
ncbi:MAG TPA: Na+/H+ antiporter NhaC family protein [Longimicrobiales bacterium]|nr:Na+/H+ antiporter NhaC family protein [Longimicrobiales bacterium]